MAVIIKPLANGAKGPGYFTTEGAKVPADNAKDFSNILINFGLTSGKEQNKKLSLKKLTDVKKKIDYIFESTVVEWQQALTDVNKALFSGDAASVSAISRLMHDGNMLDRNVSDAIQIKVNVNKFLFSVLIPETWRMQGFYPVPLDTAFPCQTKGIGIRQWTDKADVGEALICRDTEKSVSKADKVTDGSYGEGPGCNNPNPCRFSDCKHYLTALPGLKDILPPVEEFGGLYLQGMVDNARDGQDKLWNGNNHKYTSDDVENQDFMLKLAGDLNGDLDISKLLGIVNIPTCSWTEIQANWAKGITDENMSTYPCNGV